MDEVKSIYGAACKHPTLRLLQLDNNNSSSSKDVDAVVDTLVINATTATGHVSKRVRISNSNYTDKDDQHHPHQHQHVDRVSSSSSELMKSKHHHQYIVPSQMRSMMDIDQLLQSSYQFGLDLREEIHKLQQVSKEGSSLID